jgi:prophage regulatory protein
MDNSTAERTSVELAQVVSPTAAPTNQISGGDELATVERRPRGHRSQSKLQQPLEILGVPGALLRIGTVEVIVGLKRSAIYGHLKEGRFPAPVRNGARCSRWRSDDIRAYLAAK